jgi:hypothetical protein
MFYIFRKQFATPLFALAFMLALVSCKKDDPVNVSGDVQAQLELAKKVLAANTELGRSTVLNGQSSKEKGAGFADEAVDDRCGSFSAEPQAPLAFPKTLSLDYGTGCTDIWGVDRAGNIKIVLQKIWEPGATSSIEYGNYSENKVKMNGKVSLSNVSDNTGIGLELAVANLKRTEANGAESSVQAALKYRQTAGAGTFWDWKDDVYEITGSTQIALADGQKAAMSITVPLSKSNNCLWAAKGKATLVVNGVNMEVDLGNGACDNEALVTIDGKTYTIKF